MNKTLEALARAYQEVINPQPIEESHFKVGDKVEYEAPDGGEYDGEVIKLDEPQTGAYYHVKLENGKVVKAKADQLEKEDDEDEEEMKEAKMDPVNKKALKKDFDDRDDKDINNDGDVDSSDEYLHKRRKAVSKAMKDDPKGNKGETATMNPKAEQKEEVEVDEALKPYDKNADFRIVNRLKPKQRTGTLTPGEKKQLANAQARLRNHGVTESFRDKLLSVLEKKTHGNVDNKQEYDDNWSPGAKQMKKDHEPEVMADINKVSDDVAKATKAAKTSPKRPNDNTQGDKNIINPPEDVTKKAGMKTESFASMIKSMSDAYKSMYKKDEQ